MQQCECITGARAASGVCVARSCCRRCRDLVSPEILPVLVEFPLHQMACRLPSLRTGLLWTAVLAVFFMVQPRFPDGKTLKMGGSTQVPIPSQSPFAACPVKPKLPWVVFFWAWAQAGWLVCPCRLVGVHPLLCPSSSRGQWQGARCVRAWYHWWWLVPLAEAPDTVMFIPSASHGGLPLSVAVGVYLLSTYPRLW